MLASSAALEPASGARCDDIAVPEWPVFLRGCLKYRETLDRELPDAPRTSVEFSGRR